MANDRFDRTVDERLRATLATIAPGTDLRDALERILRGNTGGLIVLGHDKTVESLCTGGFNLDIETSAPLMREIAKMDGAIVLDTTGTRILKANVHLQPDPSIPTSESGTRHRTAERTNKQTGYPVISVSQSMRIIALYVGGRRYVLDDSGAILSRANQALATLERYKLRLDEVSGTLSALEIEDLVTVRDAAAVAQRLEMVRRIASEIEGYVVELGTDGRLLSLQLDELCRRRTRPRPGGPRLPARLRVEPSRHPDEVLRDFDGAGRLRAARPGARSPGSSGWSGRTTRWTAPSRPRGYRLLAKVPRLPNLVVDRLVDHFGGLQKLLAAGIDDLQAVEGVGETRARSVREGLSRLAESSILERYV